MDANGKVIQSLSSAEGKTENHNKVVFTDSFYGTYSPWLDTLYENFQRMQFFLCRLSITSVCVFRETILKYSFANVQVFYMYTLHTLDCL